MKSTFVELVSAELKRARELHAPMASQHEGYATILEEVDELWDIVKLKPTLRAAERLHSLEECVQIAAMAQRFAEDLLGDLLVKEEEDDEASQIPGVHAFIG